MRRNVLVGLLALVAAVGVYVTNFIFFRHDLTAAWLAEVTFTIPALTSEQIYLIERRYLDDTQTTTAIERLYFNDHNHLWVEKTGPTGEALASELWLDSPTTTKVEHYALTNAKKINRTTESATATADALYASAFYDWFKDYTQNPSTAPTPVIARQTERVENMECYRIDWTTPTASVTTWISADNYRIVKEQQGAQTTYYTASIIPSDQVPFSFTLAHWLDYYQMTAAAIN